MKLKPTRSTLSAYSSDGSIYEAVPRQIIQVLSIDDILLGLTIAKENNWSITSRGGGTGLAGGAVTDGVVLDFGKFKSIDHVDTGSRTVTTRVGIVYEELNRNLKKHGLFFPPDPSSGDTCQLGGMIANNSSGPRSVKYGLTSEFVEELEIITADSKAIWLKKLPVDSDLLNEFFDAYPSFKEAYKLIRDNKQLIQERWPKLKKNSAGYNLKQVVDDLENGIVNLPAIFVGSEGTLGIHTRAKLRLLPIPGDKLTVRLYFSSLVDAGRAVMPIKELNPAGLEIVDGSTLNLIGRDKYNISDNAAALLLVEFDEDVKDKKAAFENIADTLNLLSPPDYADNAEQTAELWKARKAIVPILYRHHPTRRPLPIIEDVSLPSEEVPAFIEYVTQLFEKHDLTFGIFGHIGDGNLHIRPLFDLNDESEFDLAKRLYDEVYDKVIAVGGSSTAEHADGRLRAPIVKRLYGRDIYDLFIKIKKIFDPDNVLSPNNIIGNQLFTTGIDFEKIKSFCAACGKCNGYCPAYDIFRREDFSPRGWLRMINQSGADRRELSEYLTYCLNCKNCATVCPAGVDIAGEIIKFRSEEPSEISKVIIGAVDNKPLFEFGLSIGKITQPLLKTGFGKSLMMLPGGLFGWDKSVELPHIARKSLRQRFADRIGQTGDIAFFHGCADNWFNSDVGSALFEVFDYLELNVKIPDQKCCGLPMEVYGHKDNLIAKARYNIDKLERFETIITGCASCLLRLKEYAELLENDEEYSRKALDLNNKCFDISEFLNAQKIDWTAFASKAKLGVTYHNPCHLRAAGLHKEPEKLLEKIDNVKILTPEFADRCCGQAGSYGYTHFREGKRIFAKKIDDYANIDAEYLMTSCPACQMKIRAELNGKFKVVHPIEILADLLNQNENEKDNNNG